MEQQHIARAINSLVSEGFITSHYKQNYKFCRTTNQS
jgi:hypothetical protein